MRFIVNIEINDVAEGDAIDLAQHIWNEHAEDLDAARGDFKVTVLRDGKFDIDWQPAT